MLKQIMIDWALKNRLKKMNIDVDYNVKDYLEKIVEYFDAKKSGERRMTIVYEFHDSGRNDGTWTVKIDGAKCELSEGESEVFDTKLYMTAEAYRRIITGKLDFARLAYSTGAVRFYGNSLGHRELNAYLSIPSGAGLAAL